MRLGGIWWLVRQPLDDYIAALGAVFPPVSAGRVACILLGVALSWWIYVPVHELAHAWGCVLGGGQVTRLEIDPIYGARLLQTVFPFVVAGSEYAGQLTGFDTGGSDWTYLLTDFLPFLLTIGIGVPLLRWIAAGRGSGSKQALLLGVSLPLAYAPFISLPGDYYEMGSIVVSDAVGFVVPGLSLDRWRSDDVWKLISDIAPSAGFTDIAGITASLFTGCLLACLTYAAGCLWSQAIGVSDERR